MSYENNFYYNPEKSGLKIIDQFDTGGGYDFDKFVIWQNEEGNLYYAIDSGCSCPTPFEDYNILEELSVITHNSFNQFETDFHQYCDSSRKHSYGGDSISIMEQKEVIDKIKDLLI